MFNKLKKSIALNKIPNNQEFFTTTTTTASTKKKITITKI